MKRLWNRGIRLAVMTLGFAGLIVASMQSLAQRHRQAANS